MTSRRPYLDGSGRISFPKNTVVCNFWLTTLLVICKAKPCPGQSIHPDARVLYEIVMASPKPDATEAYSMESKKAQGAMNDALSNALTTAAPWLAISSASVWAANSYWPAFRKSFGASGKTSLIIMPPIVAYNLAGETPRSTKMA